MNASTRRLVRARAERRCEYCRFHEDDLPLYRFHIEHLLPKKHGGSDDPGNLGWSCNHCNLARSSNLSGRDSVTGRIVVLFNPRRQRWQRHFMWNGPILMGRTPCGRATVDVLNINAPRRAAIRALLILAGQFPPE